LKKRETVDDAITAETVRIIKELESNGIVVDDLRWRGCRDEAMMIVTLDYCKRGNFEQILDLLFEQWDADGGFEYFNQVAQHMVLQNQIADAKRMWTTLIAARAELLNSKGLIAIQQYMDFLRRLGDETELDKLKQNIAELRARTLNLFKDCNNRFMNEDNFWDIICRVKKESPSYLVRSSFLQTRLLTYSADAIRKFEELFAEKMQQANTWNLWALAYLAFDGCSNDGFSDFRAWLISEGQETFENVSSNPDSIIDLNLTPRQLEMFRYVAKQTFELKTQEQLSAVAIPEGKPLGTEWTEDDGDLKLRYPALYAHFKG